MCSNVILNFADAINRADVDKILNIMTDDHLFIDSQDNRTTGKDNLRQGWIGYFTLFPDYKIEINEILKKDSLFCILGYASGTYKNLHDEKNSNHWRIPAAWTAIIQENKIKCWQVYADNCIVLEILKRHQ